MTQGASLYGQLEQKTQCRLLILDWNLATFGTGTTVQIPENKKVFRMI
jgi:hypothetical protein